MEKRKKLRKKIKKKIGGQDHMDISSSDDDNRSPSLLQKRRNSEVIEPSPSTSLGVSPSVAKRQVVTKRKKKEKSKELIKIESVKPVVLPKPRVQFFIEQVDINTINPSTPYSVNSIDVTDTIIFQMYADFHLDGPMRQLVDSLNLPPIQYTDRGFNVENLLTTSQLQQLGSAKGHELVNLLRQWEKEGNSEGYKLCLIKMLLARQLNKTQRLFAITYQALYSTDLKRQLALMREVWDELGPHYKQAIRGYQETLIRAVTSVDQWMSHPDVAFLRLLDFPGTTWEEQVDFVTEAAKSDDIGTWFPMYAILKWSDGAFSKVEGAISKPWEAFNANTYQSLFQVFLLLGASIGAQQLIQQQFTPQNHSISRIYSWEKVFPSIMGEIRVNEPMSSTSTGALTTYSYASPKDYSIWHNVRTFLNPRSVAMIQPLGGLKYWWQREALYPASTLTLNIARVQLAHDTMGSTEIELDGSLLQSIVEDDRIPNISLPDDPVLNDELLKLIINKSHRDAFDQKDLIRLQQLDVEDLKNLPDSWQNLYGVETRLGWLTLFRDKFRRTDLFSSVYLSQVHRLIGKDGKFRQPDQSLKWDHLQSGNVLTEIRRFTMSKYHNLSVTHTIDLSDQNEVNNITEWLSKRIGQIDLLQSQPDPPRKFGKKKNGFIQAIKHILASKTLPQEIDITIEGWEAYVEYLKTKGKAPKETYSVFYPNLGNSTTGFIDQFLREVQARTDLQFRAYKSGIIPMDHYIGWVQRMSAELQQFVVGVHPFDDGNGRVSRALMIHYLLAHLPVEAQKNFIGYLPDSDVEPDQDLYLTFDEWADLLYPKSGAFLDPKGAIQHHNKKVTDSLKIEVIDDDTLVKDESLMDQ